MSKNYWAERQAAALEKLTDKSIAETEKQLEKYYFSSMKKILGQFESTYNKVLLSIAEGKEPTPADLYKLDSYWMMQGQLTQELQKLGNKQAELMSKKFMKQYLTIYDAIALEGLPSFSTVDEKMAKQLINSIWVADGKSWSQRIWDNTSRLAATLNEELVQCVITGKKTTELKEQLQKRFKVSYDRADSLVRTEMAHLQTEAAKQRYKDYGITEVEVLSERDEKLCDICKPHDRERYPINGRMPVPFHPNCRCTILPVVD